MVGTTESLQKGREGMGKYQALKNLYESNMTVDSIAEALAVCDVADDAAAVKMQLEERNYDVIGVREGNEVIGFVERSDLGTGAIADYVKPFLMRDILTDSTPLIQFLHIFKNRSRIFVLEQNKVTKLITSADLQKPPIRILIFGYITLLEMNLGELIFQHFPDHSWKALISEGRLKLAQNLYHKRLEKNEDISLVECLQISDKLEIIKNDEFLFHSFGLASRSRWKKTSGKIRDLRDRIAHSNELGITMTWEEIIGILEDCEHVLEVSEALLAEEGRT
jgi:hypothetical protein